MVSLLLWLGLGGVLGWIFARLGWGSGVGPVWDVLMGATGALVGGLVYSLIDMTSLTLVHPASALIAAISACLFLLLLRMLGITRRMPDMG